jgi:hypothetical protein
VPVEPARSLASAGTCSVSAVAAERLAVETHGLPKRYRDVRALGGIDLGIEAGTVFGLLGPNGKCQVASKNPAELPLRVLRRHFDFL